jgi:hypothetical protein
MALRSALVALVALLALGAAAPAGAQVQTIGTVKVGLQERSTELWEAGLHANTKGEISGEPIESKGSYEFANPEGRPIVSSAQVYAVYWDPGDVYHGNWQRPLNEFFANMASATGALGDAFAVDTQYTDAADQHASAHVGFAGAYTDTDPYPVNTEIYPAGCEDPDPLGIGKITCVSGKQIEEELERFIADHSLPKGMGTIYYLLTPPGVTDCLAEGHCSDYVGTPVAKNESYEHSFCSYHSAINPGGPPEGSAQTILYAAIPWTAGTLGDYHLAPRMQADECQDGDWEPHAPGGEAKGVERLEVTPVEQEPNQEGLGADGSYDGGLADLIVGQIATEQQDILTDPLLNGWQTHVSAGEGAGEEVTDLCRDFFAPALGGASGVESEQEKAARALEERELEAKALEGGASQAEAEAIAKELAKKKPHHGEEGTEAGTLYNAEVGGGHYYINNAFNLAAIKVDYPGVPCLKGVSLAPSFTAPTNVNAGEIVGFDGMESNITLDEGTSYSSGKPLASYPTYEWSFGDGTSVKGFAPGAPSKNSPETTPCELPWESPCAASAFHTYAYGGTYQVTLTVTDVGGNVSKITEPITVAGAPAPSAGGGGGDEPGAVVGGLPGVSVISKSTKGGSGGAGKSKESKAPLSRPVATAIVTTTSLNTAVQAGLGVRYSVNQQVAGHFEVLLPTRLAKRLKIKGAKAKGLPAGMARETVIAYALLETTRSAHGKISIAIPGATGQRLDRLRHVKLTLRLVVRNASRTEPKTTLLMTAVKLRH